jgi:DNA primase
LIHKRAIIRALRAARVKYEEGGRRLIHIWCPFHPDRETPSLVIYTHESPVAWYCFGCRAHGKWEQLAEAMAMGQLDRDWEDPKAFKNLADDLKGLVVLDPALPPLTRPWSYGDYRGFSSQSLSRVQSLWWYDEIDQVRRIVWPVWDRESSLVGWVGRDLDNLEGSGRKYRNMPRMEATDTFWPLPINSYYPERVLILVEGITDALRLLQKGLPALAILGTAWSNTRTVLLSKMGIEKIVLAFDPDVAGNEATNKVAWQIIQAFGEANVFKWEWPDGVDPGDASDEQIEELRTTVMPKGRVGPHPWLRFLPKTIPPTWLPLAA